MDFWIPLGDEQLYEGEDEQEVEDAPTQTSKFVINRPVKELRNKWRAYAQRADYFVIRLDETEYIPETAKKGVLHMYQLYLADRRSYGTDGGQKIFQSFPFNREYIFDDGVDEETKFEIYDQAEEEYAPDDHFFVEPEQFRTVKIFNHFYRYDDKEKAWKWFRKILQTLAGMDIQ